jgi:hypothetical protein
MHLKAEVYLSRKTFMSGILQAMVRLNTIHPEQGVY